jgi:hypothetical protein
MDPRLRRPPLRGGAAGPQPGGADRPGPAVLPISLLSTAYVPAGLLPGWVPSAAAVNPYSHVADTVRAAMTGTLDAGQLAAGLAAVVAAVALTQLAAARGFAGLVHRD